VVDLQIADHYREDGPMNEQIQMSMDELLSLPVSVDLTTAGRAFGLGRTKAFELARQDRFPVRIICVGQKYRVPRSAIFEALGISSAEAVGGETQPAA
jgi:hypothetical protein